jgi:hypothetical protein
VVSDKEEEGNEAQTRLVGKTVIVVPNEVVANMVEDTLGLLILKRTLLRMLVIRR